MTKDEMTEVLAIAASLMIDAYRAGLRDSDLPRYALTGLDRDFIRKQGGRVPSLCTADLFLAVQDEIRSYGRVARFLTDD